MQGKVYHIEGQDTAATTELFVCNFYQQAYQSKYPNGFIRLYEDYSFLNGNDLVVCIRVDFSEIHANKTIVEFISGGANESLFWTGDTWGSENRRVKKFTNDLQEFCNKNNFTLSVIEITP